VINVEIKKRGIIIINNKKKEIMDENKLNKIYKW
jgi:hypothetical protein